MADNRLIIKGSDYDIDLSSINFANVNNLMSQKLENIKTGTGAFVLFSSNVSNQYSNGNTLSYDTTTVGVSAGSSFTGVTTKQTNVSITNEVNKGAITLRGVRSFAGSLGALAAARTVMNYALSTYGDRHQDPLAQAELNNVMNGISPFASIGMGAAAGGWIGAIAAGLGEITKFGINAVNRSAELKKSSISSQINYARAGISTRSTGGR